MRAIKETRSPHTLDLLLLFTTYTKELKVRIYYLHLPRLNKDFNIQPHTFRPTTTMFAFRNNTSSGPALQVELRNRQEVSDELLHKIIALQADRQLWRERELALLELLDFYRKGALQQASSSTEEVAIPEIILTSPTTVKSSDGPLSSKGSSPRRWFSPAQSEHGTEEAYIFEGLRALRALLDLSTARTALSYFRTTSQTEEYQVSATNLDQISDLVSRFAADVATLRGRCVRSQDALVPDILDSFMVDATSTLNQSRDPAQSDLEYPLELSFRFHGLLGMLNTLCQQSWCLGPQSRDCFHALSPRMNGLLAVTLVHPGGNWRDFQRCLFVGLKGATMLDGDIFSMVGMARIRHSPGCEFLDDVSWAAVFQDTDVVDVFWDIPVDVDVAPDHHLEETGALLHDSEDAASEASLTSEFSLSSEYFLTSESGSDISEAIEQAEEALAGLELSDEDQILELEALEQAEEALAALELRSQRTGGHPYLRAREGTNASLRSASFITAAEDVRYDSPEPPRGPFPFLKRGDGLRRSRIPVRIVGKKETRIYM